MSTANKEQIVNEFKQEHAPQRQQESLQEGPQAKRAPGLRPVVSEYADFALFLADMLHYLRQTVPDFSIKKSCASLRKLSPTLVTLVLQKRRRLTLDRVEEFGQLLRLSHTEKLYLKQWVGEGRKISNTSSSPVVGSRKTREAVHLLNDWLNVYVKDLFENTKVQCQPDLIYKALSHIASPGRISKSFEFLTREGFLRKTPDGKVVLEVDHVSATSELPNIKIRQFHKAALQIAHKGIDLWGPDQRLANAFVMQLSQNEYAQLQDLVAEFVQKILAVKSDENTESKKLYQILINLSPTGGNLE